MPRTRQINPSIKYYPPRLMEKLEYIKLYPMTIIEAPSGFGKTTILEHFLKDRVPQSIQRLVYDFESDEPLSIWHHICSRFAEIDPECAESLSMAGPPDEDNLSELAQAIRSLHCGFETYLWLDNYKRWKNEYSGEFLEMLTHHGGEKLHIIVSTQPVPPEVRNKVSQGGHFWRLNDDDLTFDQEDIASYFLAAGVVLSHERIQQVFTLTEGWIMALCLQMMCYINQGEFERGGMVALMEHTFWDRLTPEERRFLLKISIFPRFNLMQASVLSGMGMAETDRMLRDKRYFIHYDPDSRCFYPHTQLRRLLQDHFDQLDERQRKAIYLQGGELALQAQDRLNTLRFYYAADQWERLLEMPLTSYDVADVMADDVRPIVLDIIDRTPRAVKLRHPRAMISMAFALFIMGETGKLAAMQGEITDTIRESALPDQEKDALRGEMELLLSFLEYNRISDMSAHHRKALELLGGPAKLINVNSIWTFGSPSVLYLYWRESGALDRELEEMDTCMPIYYQLSRGHGSGAELVMRGEAHLMRGELDDALPLCYQALFVANSRRQDSIYQCGLFLLARIAFQKGNPDEVETTLQELRDRQRRHSEDLSRYTLDLAEGYFSVLSGRPEEVPRWLASGDITDKRLVMMVQPVAYIVYGRCLLAAREYHMLLGASQYFLDLSATFPNLLPQVYAHIYCAQALSALGKQTAAAERLQQAVELAVPDRLLLPFAENYAGIRALLPLTTLHSDQLEQIEQLSAPYCREPELAAQAFTNRERSIHYLLKEGLTNKEIGERLNLSPNTVRNTLSLMLKKKNVNSREQLRELPEEN